MLFWMTQARTSAGVLGATFFAVRNDPGGRPSGFPFFDKLAIYVVPVSHIATKTAEYISQRWRDTSEIRYRQDFIKTFLY